MKNLRSLSPSNRFQENHRFTNPLSNKSISRSRANRETQLANLFHTNVTSKHLGNSEMPLLKSFNKKNEECFKVTDLGSGAISDKPDYKPLVMTLDFISKDHSDSIQPSKNYRPSNAKQSTETTPDSKSIGMVSSCCGLPKVLQGRKNNISQSKGEISNCVTESITTKDSSKAILNPIRKLENANQNESICKVRFNIQGEKHDSISPKISPRKQESNQNIFKLVDDTINFIDQELTKSYKQTNIGMRGITKATVNEVDLIQKNDSICSIDLPKCFDIKTKKGIPKNAGLRHSKTHKKLRDARQAEFHSFSQSKCVDLLGLKLDQKCDLSANFNETAEQRIQFSGETVKSSRNHQFDLK